MKTSFTQETSAGIDYLQLLLGEDLPCVILLHGYGASQEDLAPIVQYIPGYENFNWIFPNGTREVPIGPYVQGRAWFPIDMMQLGMASQTGRFEEFFQEVPGGFVEAKEKLSDFLDNQSEKFSKIHLGGFSQGSMMAIDLAFSRQGIEQLILLSSTLVAPVHLKKQLENEVDFPIFQSHGKSDPVLPIDLARKLHHIFADKNLSAQYHEFEGGHEIPPLILEKLGAFLNER
jgi:phospholipase/carboxylesterase